MAVQVFERGRAATEVFQQYETRGRWACANAFRGSFLVSERVWRGEYPMPFNEWYTTMKPIEWFLPPL